EPAIRSKFPSAFRLTTPLYENVIGAFLRQPVEGRVLRQKLAGWPELDSRKKGCRLNYSLRALVTK
ncbi:MAG: hypothetical protein OQK40_01905, partial [Gammaproteobacteria bacterium]|nr:hypothetical protein [Gammaproteobacteria bacterium]MCW8958073.1 hypothetical protein [Gammaproteobacteria bacterium]MCW8992272.1 hypothetical protein [Gammaproteobacteria bacterium]